jgi:hypothetical protein
MPAARANLTADDHPLLTASSLPPGRGEHRGDLVIRSRTARFGVTDQQGVWHAQDAPGVVVWDTGDWVAYGSEGPAKIKDY